MFACDTPFQFPSTWQPIHLDLSGPPAPQPSMAYCQQRNSIPTDQIISPISFLTENLEAVPATHVAPQHTLEKMSPSWDVTPSDCPLIDFSIDDDLNRPKRGPFKDLTDRAQTAQTRKDNACVRCKMQRTRVSGLLAIQPVTDIRVSVSPTPSTLAESVLPAKR
jgi:hypothetical protein